MRLDVRRHEAIEGGPPRGPVVDCDAAVARQRAHLFGLRVLEIVDARVLQQRLAVRGATPLPAEVDDLLAVRDLERAGDVAHDGAHQVFDHPRHVVVVGVGLVGLEERELGIVAVRDALVPEDPADLVDLVEPADHQPLEVQLQRDAQRQLAVERVVVRRERPGGGAPGAVLQDRRLDLHEAAPVEEPPHRRDNSRARARDLARALVGDQVQLALAVARLDVAQAVPLLGQRPQRLADHAPAPYGDRDLLAARTEQPPPRLDEVAEVEQREEPEVVADDVAAQVQLHRPGPVAHVDERRAAHVANGDDATRDGQRAPGLLEAFALVALEERAGLRDLVGAGDGGGVGIARAEQRLALLAAQIDQLLLAGHVAPSGAPDRRGVPGNAGRRRSAASGRRRRSWWRRRRACSRPLCHSASCRATPAPRETRG